MEMDNPNLNQSDREDLESPKAAAFASLFHVSLVYPVGSRKSVAKQNLGSSFWAVKNIFSRVMI